MAVSSKAIESPAKEPTREEARPAPPSERPQVSGPEAYSAPPESPSRPWLKPLILAVVALLLVFGIIFGVRYWHYASTHTATDDATIAANITQVAPQVVGTVKRVHVSDNQVVNAGDLLVELDDATYRQNVAQAQANLDAAIAQASGAGYSVAVTRQTGTAQIEQAQGGVEQAKTGVASANADVARADASVS